MSDELRVPPHDLDAEVAVLGSMLLDVKAARMAALALEPADFYFEKHRDVFAALDKLAQDEEAVDPVLLYNELRQRGVLERVGGKAFIEHISASTPSAANVLHYAKIVHEFRLEREVLASAAAAHRSVLENGAGEVAIERLTAAKEALEASREGRAEKPRLAAPFEPFLALDDFVRPPFPTDAFPRPMRDWIEEAARAAQVPPELPGMLCVGVLSAALARKFEVEIRRGWREPLNTYCLVALPPGNRKTAIFNAATRILYDYERERQDAERAACFREKAEYEALESAVKKLANARASATEASRHEIEAQYERAFEKYEKAKPPREALQLLGDDTTPERLVSLLAEQDDRFAIFSAEGGLLQTVLGTRYSKNGTSNFDVLLKGHAGDPIRHDRKGARSIFSMHPALTLNVCVQPEILRGLAATPGAAGVGLLARFLYAIPDSTVGQREIASLPISDMTNSSYRVLVRRLLEHPIPFREIPTIRFNHAALEAMIAFESSLEPRLCDGGDLYPVVDWASKLAGATARLAALFAAADTDGTPEYVELEHFTRARSLTTCLMTHAQKALGQALAGEHFQVAHRIVRWYTRGAMTTFSARDAFQAMKGGANSVQTMFDLRPALELLRAHGYIAPLANLRKSPSGRAPAETFAVASLGYPQNSQA